MQFWGKETKTMNHKRLKLPVDLKGDEELIIDRMIILCEFITRCDRFHITHVILFDHIINTDMNRFKLFHYIVFLCSSRQWEAERLASLQCKLWIRRPLPHH